MSISPSTVVRADLLKLVEQELLGPRGGVDEEISGTPRARYAVGGLAPVTVDPTLALLHHGHNVTDEADAGADPNETGLGVSDIDPATAGQRGVAVVTDEDAGTAKDDEDRDEGPKGALTHPSSMGLRFQVPRDCGILTVTASWGRYEGFWQENEDGRRILYSRRIPVEKSAEIDVRDHDQHETLEPIQLDSDVSLRVELFPLDDRMIVELALSNDRVTGMDAPPRDWLFQTKLRVEAISGEPVFRATRDMLDPGYDETDDERRRLDLQYRHRLEFAIGRTCSVTWTEAAEDSRRATAVETTWLPTADIPQTIAGSAGGAVTAMRELAGIAPDGVRNAFAPLVDGYTTWLAGQHSIADQLPEHLREIAAEAIAEAEVVAERLSEGVSLLTTSEQAMQAFRFMNRAMRDQRIHSQIAAMRSADDSLSIKAATATVQEKGDDAASWRPVPAGVHPAPVAGTDRSCERASQWRCRQRRVAVLPDRWWKDRGLPRTRRVHVRHPPTPRNTGVRQRGIGWRRWCRRPDALHPSSPHLATVPAGRSLGLCRRTDPPREAGVVG